MNRKSTIGGGMSRVGTSVYGSSATGGGGNNTAATSSNPNPNFQLNFDSLNATRATAPLVFQDPFHVSEESVLDAFSTATAGEEVAVQIMHEVFRNACDSMANRHLERLARPYAVQSITHELLDIIRSTFVGRDSGAIRPAGWTIITEEYDKPKRTTVDSGSRGLVEAKPMMSAATRQLMEERGLLAVATPPASSHGGGRGGLRATPSNGDFLSVSRSSTSFAANNNNNLAATTSSASFSHSPSAANLANTRSNADKNNKTNKNSNVSSSPGGNSASSGSPQNPQREKKVGGVSGPTVSQMRATATQKDASGDNNNTTSTNIAGREGGGRKKEGAVRVGEKSPIRRGEEPSVSSFTATNAIGGSDDHMDKYGASPRPQRQQLHVQEDFGEQEQQHQQERDANEAEFLRSLNETKARQAKLRETREKVSAQLNQVLGGGGVTRSTASPTASGGGGGVVNNANIATRHSFSGAGGGGSGPEFVIDGITNQVIRVQKVPPLPSPRGGGGGPQKKRHQLGGEGEDYEDDCEDTDGPSADQHQQSATSLRRGAGRQQQQQAQTTQAPLPTRGTAGGIAFNIASKSATALNPPNVSNIDDHQDQQQRAASQSPAKRRGGEKRNITDLSGGASIIGGLEDNTVGVGAGAEPKGAIMSKSAVKKSTSTQRSNRAPALSNSTHHHGTHGNTMSGSNDPLSDYVKIDAPDASNKMRIRVSAAAGVATAGDSGQSSSNWSSPQGKPTHAEFVGMRETDRNALGSEKVILGGVGKRAHNGGGAIDGGTVGEEDNYYQSYSNTNNNVYPPATTPRSGGGATDPIAPAVSGGSSSPQQHQLLFGNDPSYNNNNSNTTTNTKSLLLSSTPNSRIQKTLSEARAIVAAAGGGNAHDSVLGEGPFFATSANRNANNTIINPPHRVAAMGASANGVLLGNGNSAVSNSNTSSSAPPSAATATGQRLANSVGSIPVVRR